MIASQAITQIGNEMANKAFVIFCLSSYGKVYMRNLNSDDIFNVRKFAKSLGCSRHYFASVFEVKTRGEA